MDVVLRCVFMIDTLLFEKGVQTYCTSRLTSASRLAMP